MSIPKYGDTALVTTGAERILGRVKPVGAPMAFVDSMTHAITRVAPSRSTTLLPTLVAGLDAVILAATIAFAWVGRNSMGVFDSPNHDSTIPMIAPIIWISSLVLLWGFDAYGRDAFEAGSDELRRVAAAMLTSGGLLCVANYLAHHQLSRGFFVLAYGTGLGGLILGRVILRTLLRAARVRGHFMQRVVIAGGSAQVDEVAQVFKREAWTGYEVLGALTPTGVGATRDGVRALGRTDNLVEVVTASGADILCVASGTTLSAASVREVMWQLEQYGVQVVVAPVLTDIAADRVRIRPVGGLPLVHLDPARWEASSHGAKRAFDVAVSSMILVAIAPLLAVAAWRIKRFDGGPILYRQRRIGLGGQAFDCLKFRTMVTNAEELKAALIAEQGSDGMLFKMKDDPRITKPGHWLRKYSIDELPQLINVLMGDMSLVGPRPQVQAEVDQYDNGMARRLHVRPGMTGLWQVSGRSDLSFEDARRLDIYYVDNWSMEQDISILRRTVRAVFTGSGAY